MIEFEKAKKAFDDFVKQYDENDSKVDRKIRHTYFVVEASEYLANALNLSKEDAELSKLIALLHDIGRFKQAESKCKTYDEAETTLDHAEYGVKILFEDGLIRNFIQDSKYDEIIYKAIINHNKLKIEDGLSEKELLHAKLIRDNDKTGNFTVRENEDLKTLFDTEDLVSLENEEISDKIYEGFLSEKTIHIKQRKTHLDKWISLIAFIFDYNFKESIEFIYENGYIERAFNRINYKNQNTIKKVSEMKKIAFEYIEKQLAK